MGKLVLQQTLAKHTGRVWNVAWHPKGELFASCGEDKTIRLWQKDSNKFTNICILTDGHKRTIREVAWSPCGNFIAAASFDATTSIWDRRSGEFECNTTLEGHENEVKSVAWSQSGNLLATCSRDKSVWVWEVAEDDEYECNSVINAHTQDVKKVVFHPEKDLLASASYDNSIKLFKEDPSDNDWICVNTLRSHSSTVWSIAFDKTGRIASCSDDGTVKIWKCYSAASLTEEKTDSALGSEEASSSSNNDEIWKCICTISGYHKRTIYDVSWCKVTGLLATACGDDIVRVFKEDASSGPDAPTFDLITNNERSHSQDVNCVAWHPKGEILISCSDDGEIKIWKFVE